MSKENDELLKLKSYVQISKYREKTLKSIGDDVKIPRKGRLYRLTDTGKEVLDTIKDSEED